MKEISFYFHVPFCTHKCAYCHFYVIPDHEPFKQKYLESLKCEWDHWKGVLEGNDYQIASIYFGGGTPSLLGPLAISEIIQWIKSSFSLKETTEITLEANPENISLQLMRDFAIAGINRVSIGVQTLDSTLLHTLDRRHCPKRAIEAIHATFEAGIKNISIDLMYDLPGQTLSVWENTLAAAQQLPISHLSLYNLTIEPHTLFFKNREMIKKQLPDPEESLRMYQLAVSMLDQSGLKQYEISAFAKNDQTSNHNIGYWTARPFLGFGPSAFSYWEGKRFRNVAHLNRYYKALMEGDSPIDFEEKLAQKEKLRELLAVQLRLISGVDLALFQNRHGDLDREIFTVLEALEEALLLRKQENHLTLTQKGILFYDTVASELV